MQLRSPEGVGKGGRGGEGFVAPAMGSQLSQQGLKSLPRLYLCSNYFGGVALGDCVRRGFERAREVGQYLN